MTATKSMAPPPEVIAGRYRIEGKLGQGGMGSVWRAEHLTLRSPVAIKLIDSSLASSEEALARFLREAQAAASLRSPHVVQILDHGVDNGVPYIAMELLEGESLADRLERVGKLSLTETSRIMTHTARAMSRAHEAGIVHRDLKPDNIFLVRNEDEEIAKVLDFGIAKAKSSAFDVTTGTRTGAMMGTPYYMSPEQVEGSKTIDQRTDLWAMAVIAFECITGVRPFDGDTLGALLLQICARPLPVPSQVGQVPPGFDAWFQRATQRVPDERFQSAREMADSLRVVLAAETGDRAALLATPTKGTLGHARDAMAQAASSGVVVHTAPSALLDDDASNADPVEVPRSRTLPWLLAGGVVVLLGVGAMLFAGRHEEAPQHVVQPAKPAAIVAPPAAMPSSVPALVEQVKAPSAAVVAPAEPPAKRDAPAAPAPTTKVAAPPNTKPSSSASHHVTPPRPPVAPAAPVLRVAPAAPAQKPAPSSKPKPTDLGF